MSNEVLNSGKSQASTIDKFQINSNKSGQVDLTGGITELRYYESILEPTVRVTVQYTDTGSSYEDKTVLEGLPIVGTEKCNIKMKDNADNQIEVDMYVDKVNPISETAKNTVVMLGLVSKEHIQNQLVRVNKRFDGKLSDHINEILTNSTYIGTEKDVDIEETQNNYNFIGNNKKPFYTCTWLAKKGVPNTTSPGNTAGYFFYETNKGFKFKSIDSLMKQEKKRKFIFNETPDSRGANIPKGYDGKILESSADNSFDVQSKFEGGAYSTRIVLFNPFDCVYQVVKPNSRDTESNLELGGKELPVLNKEFNQGRTDDFSRTTYMLIDTGTIPTGSTEQQIDKSKEKNFDPANVLNQASMRYNQLFTLTREVTIPGDFGLNAGDTVFIDIPSAEKDKNTQNPNKEIGGLYIISDLCHLVTVDRCLTKLNLIRDSYGRKVT